MGVKDLWQLLAPVGRRVSIETLEGKVLAIDMSIWLTQFIKAMRDDDGQMVKNAHIIGTLRRILKLLYHRIRPVFVFDGATPALKLRVIQLRRKTHEKSEQNRSTAIRRLLLAQLKQQITKQANEESATNNQPKNFSSLFHPVSSISSSKADVSSTVKSEHGLSPSAKTPHSTNKSSSSSSLSPPVTTERVADPIDHIEWTDGNEYARKKTLDEVDDNSEEDEDEPMWTLPEDNDALDVDVLTSLPINIRKRIIEDAKRRERARSRATFMPVADNPLLYSQTQLANFLKSSNLNRRFEEAHKKLEGETEQHGKKIAAENKKYQFVPRKRRLQSNRTDEPLNTDSDEDEIFTENDWARAAFQQPTGLNKSSRKKIVTFDEDIDNSIVANNVEKASSQKSASFRNRFFDDLEEEEFVPVTSSATTEENGQSKSSREVVSAWEDLVDENRERDKESVETANNHIDDEYGTGGGFFVEAGPMENAEKEDATEERVEQALRMDSQIQGERVDASQPSLTSSQLQVEELKHILWNDENDNPSMDNIEWESDGASVADESSDTENEEGGSVEGSEVSSNDECTELSSSIQLIKDPSSESKIVIDLSHQLDSDPIESNTPADTQSLDNIIPIDEESGRKQVISEFEGQTENSYVDYISDTRMSQLPSKSTIKVDDYNNSNSSSAALTRAISTASNMADWAGRVVRRVVKEHMGQDVLPAKINSFHPVPSVTNVSSLKSTNNFSSQQLSSNENSQLLTQESDNFRMDRNHINNTENNNIVSEASGRNNYTQSNSHFSSTSLVDIDAEIEASKKSLATSARDSERITEEMKSEVLHLIQAFDLPFIIAPFEAEAQCAVLEEMGLVDGVITEDSDSFLFGAKSVYKNIFNDRKYVEAYYARDIQQELGLARSDLIGLAFFLGSDYTEGVHGVGIVNAMEIIEAFPMQSNETIGPLDGLKKFRQWIEGYDFAKDIMQSLKQSKPTIKRTSSNANTTTSKTNKSANKKSKSVSFDEVDTFSDSESENVGEDSNLKEQTSKEDEEHTEECKEEDSKLSKSEKFMVDFEKKHKNGRSKWILPAHFPDESVIKAYLHPDTNRSNDPFPFIPPARSKVRRYIAETLGWTEIQLNTQVDPVLERYADRAIQTRVDSFYTMNYQDNTRFAKIASERLRDAVAKITGKETTSLVLEKGAMTKDASPSPKKRHFNDILENNAVEMSNDTLSNSVDKNMSLPKNKRSKNI